MKRHLLILGSLLAVAALIMCSGHEPRAATQEPAVKEQTAVTFKQHILPYLTPHCYECHGNGKKKAGLSLDKFTDDESVQKDRKLWDNVVHMIGTGEMPPKERPRPDVGQTAALLKAVDTVLNSFDCTKQHNVGRVTLRRLNRAEYNNTIRDLVGVDFKPAADFPADDVGYGFDNIGDVLSVSPLLLEKYLTAAESILEEAIIIAVPIKSSVNKRQGLNITKGAGENNKKGASYTLFGQGEVFSDTNFAEGDHVIRIEVSAQQAGDEPVRGAVRLAKKDLKQFELKDEKRTKIEFKISLKTVTQRLAVAFLNPFTEPEAKEGAKADQKPRQRQLTLHNLEVEGPFNAPPPPVPDSHKKIMAHKAGAKPREAAREIVGRFAALAFRRPVPDAEVESLLKLYDKGAKDKLPFEDAVKHSLYRILVSPHFLYRAEIDPPDAKPGKAYAISEYNLASRLSYFLWSSMPDEQLLTLARKGELRKNLTAEVQRMLKDKKSSAFVENFAGQWLTLRNLASVNPDPKKFPKFDNQLRDAMLKETELFFEAILRENRSILDLIDADFSFVNDRLAKHYGIEGVKGKGFQRVKMPANRGGLLTQASILTITSEPNRTSPVKRGKWVLEQLLNTPPPPPPEDVPDLAEQRELKGTLRQQMEMHRKNPICASCHARMDPLGFAFENYDAIGVWRDKDDGFPVDASGTLPNGKAFTGAAELKKILLEQKDLLARALSEKILTYALGRGLEYYDKCAVDKVVTALAKDDYRFGTLMLEVVNSEPFQMRMPAAGKIAK